MLAHPDAGELIDDLAGAVTALGRLHQFARGASERPALIPVESNAAELLHDVVRLVGSDPAERARLTVASEAELYLWCDRLAIVKVMLRAIGWISSLGDAPTAVHISAEARGAFVAFILRATPPLLPERLIAELSSALTFDVDRHATLTVARELAIAVDATLESDGADLVLSVQRALD